MANPTQARTTAKTLAVRMSKASFRRIERSLNVMRLLSTGFPHHVFRQEQQPRPDFEYCRCHGIEIDVEAHLVLFQQKTDHSARIEKPRSLSNRQDGSIVQIRHQRRNVFALGPPEKQNLTSLHILRFAKMTNSDDPISDCLAGYCAFQRSLKRILSEGA